MLIKKNCVKVSGRVKGQAEFNHKCEGESFYKFTLESKRDSGTSDLLPVIASETMLDDISEGNYLVVSGEFRSHNQEKEGKLKLVLYVFATDCAVLADEEIPKRDKNYIELEGFVVKKPGYRVTPLGREITELLLASNRGYGKSDYIPCLTWGRNAKRSAQYWVGDEVRIVGRIQSRDYVKKIDGEEILMTAYEVSASSISKEDSQNGQA